MGIKTTRFTVIHRETLQIIKIKPALKMARSALRWLDFSSKQDWMKTRGKKNTQKKRQKTQL